MESPGLRRRSLLAALAACAGSFPAGRRAAAAGGADFPSRPVRLVVPYSVGVGPDVVARSLAERLAARWGQPVIVDNKPGASGIVAFGEVRHTPPDGHTLFLADTATLVVNPLVHASLPYDPVRDLVPLTLLFRATLLPWVGAANRFHGIGELLDAARAAPDSVSYATLGNGHASHVAMETLARAAGVRMLHVPFKDAGAMLAEVAAGEVDLTAIGANTVAGLVAGGRLRSPAVVAKTRLASHPQIPTLGEAGAPPVEMHPWAALVAVAGTPAATVTAIAARHRGRAGIGRSARPCRSSRLRDHALNAAGAARAHALRPCALRNSSWRFHQCARFRYSAPAADRGTAAGDAGPMRPARSRARPFRQPVRSRPYGSIETRSQGRPSNSPAPESTFVSRQSEFENHRAAISDTDRFQKTKGLAGNHLLTPVILGSPTWARTRDLRINSHIRNVEESGPSC